MSKKVAPKGSKKAPHAEELPDEPPLDPAIQSVQSSLEANLTFFMSNIGAIIKRYDESLEKAVPPTTPASTTETAPVAAAAAAEPAEKKKITIKKPSSPTGDKKKPSTPAGDKKPASPKKEGAADAAAAADEDEGEEIEIIEVEFPDNTALLAQLASLKREAYELATTFDGIHDWIALNIPDMRGDETSGVQVMGAVIEQLQSLNEAVRGTYSLELKYLGERSELEQAVLKVPDSETLKLSLEVTDSDTWDDVERGWRTLIRVCLIAYSVLAKNMGKLRDPKGMSTRANGMLFM